MAVNRSPIAVQDRPGAGIAAGEVSQRPAWLRYGLAVALTLAAVWLRVALVPADSGGRFVTPALAVALAALYGGLGPGLLSLALGMLLVNFFLIAPYGSFAFDDLNEAFWLNAWHLITQLVVVGAISLMQSRNRQLREATRQIREGHKRFLDTFEHAASGITHVDSRGRLLRANQTFCDMVGYSKAELERLTFQDITEPEDIGPDWRLLEETLAGQRSSYTLEKRYRHKNGQKVWVQLTVALMRTPEGEPDYFISVVQDLRAQKAAEQALRTSENLLQQAQKLSRLSSWHADLVTGHFRPLSDIHSLLGLDEREYSAQDVLTLAHPEDRPRVEAAWMAAVQHRQPYHIEHRILANGVERWVMAQALFEYDDHGRALRALGITRDITEEKTAQLEIQRLNATLEQRIRDRTHALRDAYDELESYSYAVAHDLRSPLRIINGFAQALQEDQPALDRNSQDHLRRIMGASKKMGELIDGLLKLSQFARGEVQRQRVDLSAIATHILEELCVAEPQRAVDWMVEPALMVQADPALIEALMQNLLDNAWKYSAGATPARIRVFSRDTEGLPEICVADNGAGFDMARADKLFQPFQRLHQPHEFTGLGIGLATARRIVQRHGGALRAHSAPGEGAVFSFTLGSRD
jgi:PAS domain S-box-containing protein